MCAMIVIEVNVPSIGMLENDWTRVELTDISGMGAVMGAIINQCLDEDTLNSHNNSTTISIDSTHNSLINSYNHWAPLAVKH